MPVKFHVLPLSLFFLAGILFSRNAGAQPGSIFYHITTDQGLASNRCNSVLQDTEGYYWIATDNGLSRFDGSHCRNFRKNGEDSSSLSSNLAYTLLEDKLGDIWVGTYQGINRYNKKKGTFTRYYLSHPGISAGYNNIVRSLDLDNEGNIWVAAGGLWRYDASTQNWTLFENDRNDTYGFPGGTVMQVAFDRTLNGIWILTGQRLCFYDISRKKFISDPGHASLGKVLGYTGIINFTLQDGRGIWFSTHQDNGGLFFYDFTRNAVHKKMLLEGKGLRRMSLDNTGKLWLHFYAHKTQILDTKTKRIDTAFLSAVHDQSALSEQSSNLYIDKAGCYWIASEAGVNIYNPSIQSMAVTSFVGGPKVNRDKLEIKDILQLDSVTSYIATTQGIYSYVSGEPLSIRKLPFAGSLPVDKMHLTGGKTLWFAVSAKLYRYDLTHQRLEKILNTESRVQSMLEGNNGLLYVATWMDGIFVIDQKGKLKQRIDAAGGGKLRSNWIICAVLSKTKDHIWIGYNGGKGFSKYRISDGSVTHHTISVSLPESRAANTINHITEYDGNVIWLGTYGAGLWSYNTATGTYTNFTDKNGLQSDFVFQAEPDSRGNLWISTPTGIFYKAANTDEIVRTGIELPELNNDVAHNIIPFRKGSLLFFRKDKMVQLETEKFFNSGYPSKILLTAIKAGQQEITLDEKTGNKIEVPYLKNDISIEFSLLRPNSAAKPVYSYWLKGADKGWINAENRNFVYYANLKPGKYTFMARAADPISGKTYYSKQVDMTILPPWWATTWFRLLALALFTGLSLLGIRSFIRSKLRRQREALERQLAIQSERERITADLHDDVGATLSSMYIYGDLAANIWETKPQQSREMVYKMTTQAKELMNRMGDIVWSLKPFSEDKNTLTARLKNYSNELLASKSIECEFQIDEHVCSHIRNPVARKNILLIAKEAMNNIAKYSRATRAMIVLRQAGQEIILEMNDNGIGFDPGMIRAGNGLQNMEQRCAALGGRWAIHSATGRGTIITCTFPMTTISHMDQII